MDDPNPILAQIEQKALLTQLESAREHARNMNQRAVQVSMDIGKEKTQYFEKLSLAAGGTIALVVSFVGSHAGRLQPPWLLRSALVALVLAMFSGMYRNWKFPFYLLATAAREDTLAKQNRDKCGHDYCVRFPSAGIDSGGKPLDLEKYQRDFDADTKIYEGLLAKCKKQEDSAFKAVMVVEYATLFLLATGMGLLVALAWKNF